MDEITVSEYWSDDKIKNAKVIKGPLYGDAFKLVMKNIVEDREIFKFHRHLDVAENEAEDFVSNA